MDMFECRDDAMDFLKLTISQESLQAPIQIVQPVEFTEIEELDGITKSFCDDFGSKIETAVSMESLLKYLEQTHKKGLATPEMLEVTNYAMESYLDTLGYGMPKPIALEDFNLGQEGLFDIAKGAVSIVGDTVGAVYNGAKATAGFIADVSVGVYRFVKKKLVLLARHIVKLVGSFARARRKLESRIREVEERLGKVNRTDPIVPYIKAESWHEYLCYTKRPFEEGLEGIYNTVDTLVHEHKLMAKAAMKKNLTFMERMSESGDTVEEYSCSPKEYLLPGMEEFHRSVGFDTPSRDNIYFRSHELPGGRAFFTQVNPSVVNGVEAIRSLEVIDFDLFYWDPKSYEVFKMKLAAAIAIPMTVFLALMHPVLAVAAIGAASTYIATRGVDNTGAKVEIDPSTIFKCLSIDEAKRVIGEVRQGLVGLKEWADVVLLDPWKSQDIDQLVINIIDRDDSNSNMKAFCNATLSLMSHLSVGVHSYAFKVYNAMLNFAEKSLKQYR